MPPSTRSLVRGSSGICPAQKSRSPLATAWEYGPTAAGAAGVEMTRFIERGAEGNSQGLVVNGRTPIGPKECAAISLAGVSTRSAERAVGVWSIADLSFRQSTRYRTG